jgi:hypothetical protein
VLLGRISGRNESDTGQIGVRRRQATSGCTTLPPPLKLYAVLPVAVETIKPSLDTVKIVRERREERRNKCERSYLPNKVSEEKT